jgi:hypothetical protein
MQVINAKITGTTLGFESHGIMTFFIQCEFNDCESQGFGGYRLDEPFKNKDGWKGHAFGIALIRKIIETVGVEKWEDLKGKFIKIKKDGWQSPIEEISHITKNNWFNVKDLRAIYSI